MLRLRRDWAVVWLLLLAVPLPARADTEKDRAVPPGLMTHSSFSLAMPAIWILSSY